MREEKLVSSWLTDRGAVERLQTDGGMWPLRPSSLSRVIPDHDDTDNEEIDGADDGDGRMYDDAGADDNCDPNADADDDDEEDGELSGEERRHRAWMKQRQRRRQRLQLNGGRQSRRNGSMTDDGDPDVESGSAGGDEDSGGGGGDCGGDLANSRESALEGHVSYEPHSVQAALGGVGLIPKGKGMIMLTERTQPMQSLLARRRSPLAPQCSHLQRVLLLQASSASGPPDVTACFGVITIVSA